MPATIVALHRDDLHRFSKQAQSRLHLLEGLGVEGDAHCGATVRHRSRVKQAPTQPNLRQVHLLHAELFNELARRGFDVKPGELGENITTRGTDLLALPVGTQLHLGAKAIVTLTGLRNPCRQIERFQGGLLAAVLDRGVDGQLIRKAGVMGVVSHGGWIETTDPIRVVLPPEPHRALERV